MMKIELEILEMIGCEKEETRKLLTLIVPLTKEIIVLDRRRRAGSLPRLDWLVIACYPLPMVERYKEFKKSTDFKMYVPNRCVNESVYLFRWLIAFCTCDHLKYSE